MNIKISKGMHEFDDENYENALRYFDEVRDDDEDYMYVLMFKITCLMELERYDKALFLIESLLSEDPDDKFLFYEKIRCHIALGENENALEALKIFENNIPYDNKRLLLAVSKFYRILDDSKSALKFCNSALSLDKHFTEAIYEKALIAIDMDDKKMINDCADELLKISDCDNLHKVTIFLFKLYCGDYRGCINVIGMLDDEFDDETIYMLKSVLYKEFSENLGVNILFSSAGDIPIDDAISLLQNYDECGVDGGVIRGVPFKIM